MKILLVVVSVIGMICTSCVKLYENVDEEYVKRPSYDVEIPIDPPWDDDTSNENNVGN